MSAAEDRQPSPTRSGRLLIRAGEAFGLLFLIGPLSDLAGATMSAPRLAAIVAALLAFVALYLLALTPPQAGARARRGGAPGAVALLAVLAALPLALGAPRSFVLLFVYVVVVAGVVLPPRLAVPVTVAVTAAIGAGLAATSADGSTVAAYVLTVLGVGAVMIALGSTARANRELRAAREELARHAVAEERARFARDLHDLLGHTLSLIALKSELAAKLVATDPGRAEAELADVQTVTRQALRDVREAVQGYGRRSLADALASARETIAAAGIDCRVDRPAVDLPAEVESVLAWAVREASTNVVRHSGARTCVIALERDAAAVSLEVRDDGVAGGGQTQDGTGLAGLGERARRLQGSLEAGACPEGGFRLSLTLPLEAS